MRKKLSTDIWENTLKMIQIDRNYPYFFSEWGNCNFNDAQIYHSEKMANQ